MLARAVFILALSGLPVLGDSPKVTDVRVTPQGDGWRFDVTVRHEDSGWDHYADGWYVLTPEGAELGHRKLLHPHQNEQPFTRSLSGVQIPESLKKVHVQANDSVHGRGPVYEVAIPVR